MRGQSLSRYDQDPTGCLHSTDVDIHPSNRTPVGRLVGVAIVGNKDRPMDGRAKIMIIPAMRARAGGLGLDTSYIKFSDDMHTLTWWISVKILPVNPLGHSILA